MKRKYIKHGDILEIHLPQLNRFIYGKIIDPNKITNPIDLPYFIRIYKNTYDKSINILSILERELLLAPFYVVGISAAITKFNWRIISNEDVMETEEWIPDTKEGWPLFIDPPKRWGYKKRHSTELVFSEFENIKHLTNATGKNIEIVPFLIQMELLKLQDKDIKMEFGLNNWLEELIYDEFNQLPIYTKLPFEIQGKAVQQSSG